MSPGVSVCGYPVRTGCGQGHACGGQDLQIYRSTPIFFCWLFLARVTPKRPPPLRQSVVPRSAHGPRFHKRHKKPEATHFLTYFRNGALLLICSNHCSFAHPASYFLHSLTLFTYSLHWLRCRPCSQMPLPPHSLHRLRCRPCSQRPTTPHVRPRCLPAFTASAGEANCGAAVALSASEADANDSSAAITH